MFKINDPHTDSETNWIEEQSFNVASYLDAGYSEEKIIEELLLVGVPEEMLSLILVSGRMIWNDEVNDYRGE